MTSDWKRPVPISFVGSGSWTEWPGRTDPLIWWGEFAARSYWSGESSDILKSVALKTPRQKDTPEKLVNKNQISLKKRSGKMAVSSHWRKNEKGYRMKNDLCKNRCLYLQKGIDIDEAKRITPSLKSQWIKRCSMKNQYTGTKRHYEKVSRQKGYGIFKNIAFKKYGCSVGKIRVQLKSLK